MPIVISAKATDGTRQVAQELADYLSQISGARFEVQTGDGSRGIVLGTLAEFPHPELAAGLEIRNTYNGKEAYAIRTEPQRLLLIGATELGARTPPSGCWIILAAAGSFRPRSGKSCPRRRG